jgi:hypothetical protein
VLHMIVKCGADEAARNAGPQMLELMFVFAGRPTGRSRSGRQTCTIPSANRRRPGVLVAETIAVQQNSTPWNVTLTDDDRVSAV